MRDEVVAFLTDAQGPSVASDDLLARSRTFFRERCEALGQDLKLHPLGFYYASEPLDHNRQFRFHLWPLDWSTPEQEKHRELHDHLYSLNSLVIAGALRHETFEVVQDENGPYEICRVEYGSSGSGVHGTATYGVEEIVTSGAHVSGCAYRLRPGTFHRVTPLKLPSATLVLTDVESGPRQARVLVRRGVCATQTFARAPLRAHERESVLLALAAL